MNSRSARANTSGSFSATQRSFGPTAWVVSAEPQRSRISCSPSSWVSASIWRVARVSTP